MFTVYLVANVWLVLVEVTHDLSGDKEDVEYFASNGSDWDLEIMNTFDFGVTILYFTFTSLSTVGFGDYYPITDFERIFCSFLLLFGVATFSYTMS